VANEAGCDWTGVAHFVGFILSGREGVPREAAHQPASPTGGERGRRALQPRLGVGWATEREGGSGALSFLSCEVSNHLSHFA
jgi:hypothetical protein